MQSLNGLAQHRAQFSSLHEVIVYTDGRVFTREAPDRQSWTQLAVTLKSNWAGLPPKVWTAAKLLGNKNCEVDAAVYCLYYPYMEGKKRDWHEKGGSWGSLVSSYPERMRSSYADIATFQQCIDLNSGTSTRISGRPTQVISGPWPKTGFQSQKKGAATIRVFDEDQVVRQYAGQDGNPFKKP